jgi:hypothetical protein
MPAQHFVLVGSDKGSRMALVSRGQQGASSLLFVTEGKHFDDMGLRGSVGKSSK